MQLQKTSSIRIRPADLDGKLCNSTLLNRRYFMAKGLDKRKNVKKKGKTLKEKRAAKKKKK